MEVYVRNQGKLCEVEGCDLLAVSKLMCRGHYDKLRRHGDPLYSGVKKRLPQDVCSKCGDSTEDGNYYRGHTTRCKRCHIETQEDTLYFRKYGVTTEMYQEMLDAQNGVCAICLGAPVPPRKRLCIDHDHSTGAVRGLLCHKCNAGLGMFNDDKELIMKAIDWLKTR